MAANSSMMIATARIFRRRRPSPPSFNRSASSLSTLATNNPAVLRRNIAVSSLRARAATIIENPHRIITHHNGQPSYICWFSTSSSSPPSSSNGDGPPSIEVTITNSKSPTDPSSLDHPQGESSAPTRSKSDDQVTEEEILSLQSDVRTHHRHAAYDTALETASQLLEMTSTHFGNLHPATASAYNNVGLMNKLLGNYGEAKEAYHESLRVYGEVCGKDHASYAAALSNLGMLERGLVLESEAADGEEGADDNTTDGESSSSINNEDEVELEELRDSNSKTTPENSKKMSALERMQLNESAIEYFDEAYRIRLSELGAQHPHTITSRSQLGSAMAAAVVAERKGRIGGLVESELRKLKRSRDVKDAREMESYVPEAIARAAAKSSSSSKLTRRRWEAAEEHLRGALGMAVDNPRGESVGPLMFIPIGSAASSFAADGDGAKDEERQEQRGLTLPPKKDRSLSKKDRKQIEKERKREKRQANVNALQSSGSSGDGSVDHKSNISGGSGKMSVQGVAVKVTTLSAATAAQNLAVFLKHYSDWMRLSLMDESGNAQQQQLSQLQQPQITKLNQTIQEARHLYESALHVRSSILPPHHPEVVASKFSLAELLDSPATVSSSTTSFTATAGGEEEDVVDGNRANALREEILNAYNVEEREDGSSQ